MRVSYWILFYILLTVTYNAFSVSGDCFWDSFFFMKDYFLPPILALELRKRLVLKREKALCLVVVALYAIKFITDVGYIAGLLDITKLIDTFIHVLFMMIVLILLGYDKRG